MSERASRRSDTGGAGSGRDWPVGPGEMPGRIRAHDWSATPLGPAGSWPQSLRSAVDLVLGSPLAMTVLWGPDLVQIYNDGYRLVLAAKHPSALGQPTRECWPEIWEFNAPIYREVLRGGARSFSAQKLRIQRHHLPEDAWFDLNFSPLRDETGGVAGVLVTVVETTARVAAEQRLRDNEKRFRGLVNATSYAVYRMSPDWTEMRHLDGRGFIADTRSPRINWPEEYVHSDDRPAVLKAIRRAVETASAFEIEHRLRRTDGSLGWTVSRAVPILGPDGEVEEWFGTLSDVTAQRRTEDALRESEARLRTALLAARMATWFWDPVADTLSASETYPEIFGMEPGHGWEDSERFYRLLHPDDRAAYRTLVETAGRERRGWETRFRVIRPRDGRTAWLEERASAVADPASGKLMITGLVWDVTRQHEAEDALRKSESNARLLLAELQHRVRNTLAVIRSIAARTAATSESVEDFQMHLDGRIGAFARVQSSVTRDPGRGLDLASMVANELAAAVAHEGRQVTLDGPEVRLPAKTAETLGLAFHELATNAVKHGALSIRDGHIHIAWDVTPGDPPVLSLAWKESGVEMQGRGRLRKGFGTELMERLLPYQLGARTTQAFEPDGLRSTIELPLPA